VGEHPPYKRAVMGSIPIAPILFGTLAQLVEHRTFNPAVLGSNPRRPTPFLRSPWKKNSLSSPKRSSTL
jgi:hypothetical protein